MWVVKIKDMGVRLGAGAGAVDNDCVGIGTGVRRHHGTRMKALQLESTLLPCN